MTANIKDKREAELMGHFKKVCFISHRGGKKRKYTKLAAFGGFFFAFDIIILMGAGEGGSL